MQSKFPHSPALIGIVKPIIEIGSAGINRYFGNVTRTLLTHELVFDIDLNPISEDVTQLTIEIGKTYDFGTFYVYVTDIKVDYENRTARIKGLGKVI